MGTSSLHTMIRVSIIRIYVEVGTTLVHSYCHSIFFIVASLDRAFGFYSKLKFKFVLISTSFIFDLLIIHLICILIFNPISISFFICFLTAKVKMVFFEF